MRVKTEFSRLDDEGETWRGEYNPEVKSTVLEANLQLVDSHKTSTYKQILDVFCINGTEQQSYWNKCACNELDALVRRHYPLNLPELYDPVVEIQELYVKNWKLFIDGLSATRPYKLATHSEVIASCRPNIKKRYIRAYEKIINNRLVFNKGLASVKAFVKYEKVPIGKFEAGKAPRCIQYRDFTYLYALKRVMLPITKVIKDCIVKNVFGQPVNTIFTKNYSGSKIASLLKWAWDQFTCPVGVCIDHSTFDGRYARPLIGVEITSWNDYITRTLKKLGLYERLLNEHFVTKGFTSHGIRFIAVGKRCSGEYTTSEGNGSSNKSMIESVFEYLYARAFALGYEGTVLIFIFVNGDDSVIMIESSFWLFIQEHFPEWLDFFKSLNMKTEMDRAVYVFEQISYCQASPVLVKGLYQMVKTPLRALSRACYSDKPLTPKSVLRYYRGLGLCELATSSGVPILQALAVKFLLLSQGARPLGSVDKVYAKSMNQGGIEYTPVTTTTRMSFALAFGISISEQLSIEEALVGHSYIAKTIHQLVKPYKYFHLN